MVRRKPFTGGKDERTKQLAAVAKDFKEFKPAVEVLTPIEAVPTIFPQYDVAAGVGGHPISRFTLVHGPSNEGKTTFVLGLGKSFLERGHFFAFADAERTTPPEWLSALYGPLMQSPGFVALPVSSYEQTVEGVRDFCTKVAKARSAGNLPEDCTGVIVVDSIRKLMPKNLLSNLMAEAGKSDAAEGKGKAAGKKKKPKGVDGFGGRAAQLKAALNAAWMDELVPLLADTRMAMVVIARETDDADADEYALEEDRVKVGGGKAIYYEGSLVVRVSRTFIRDDEDKSRIYGERHKLVIRKTKVARKEEAHPKAYFHTSNGMLGGPEGFDVARDLLELGQDMGLVEVNGSWFSYDLGEKSGKLGQGKNGALKFLYSHPEVLADLHAAVRDVAFKTEEKKTA